MFDDVDFAALHAWFAVNRYKWGQGSSAYLPSPNQLRDMANHLGTIARPGLGARCGRLAVRYEDGLPVLFYGVPRKLAPKIGK